MKNSVDMDPFEQKLASQPLRRPDPALREVVLAACRAAASECPPVSAAACGERLPGRTWWQVLVGELFTPCRPLYGGLASIWLVIVLVNWVAVQPGAVESRAAVRHGALPPVALETLRQQRELLTELTRLEAPMAGAVEAGGLPPRSAVEPPARHVWRRRAHMDGAWVA